MSEANAAPETQTTFETEGATSEGGRRKRFGDLHPVVKALVVVLGIAQIALAAVAIADLVRRPAKLVRGPKAAWAPAMAINFVGPIAYLRWGRIEKRSKLDVLKGAPAALRKGAPSALKGAPAVVRGASVAARAKVGR
jgi:hypothetical protein